MAKANGRKPARQRRERALQVSGVGNGSQQCHYDCQLPVAIRPEGKRELQHATLELPAVTDSDLPGLMGLSALRKNRAILDFNTLTLYFCGKDNYDLKGALPAKTDKYKLETAPSGHLVLPCCEYKAGTNSEDYSMTLMARTALPSTIVEEEPAKGKARRSRRVTLSSPPDHSPVLQPQHRIPSPPPFQPVDSQEKERGRSRTLSAHNERS